MKIIIASFAITLIFISGSSPSLAIPDTQRRFSLSNSSLTISGPADSASNSMGKTILNSGSRSFIICNNPNLVYDLGRIEYTPLATWTGETFSAGASFTPYYLYQSGVKGLRLGPFIRGDRFTSGLTGNGVFNPAPPDRLDVWTGNINNSNRISTGIVTFALMYLNKGADRLDNSTVLPEQSVYMYTCYDNNNVAQETNTFILNSLPINNNVTGCTPDAKATTVNMEGIPAVTIENAAPSTLISTRLQTFSLKCDPNILLRYSVVDLNDPTNNTITSTLTSDSTATGVGYAITSPTGTRLQFGPDGSASGIPGQIKYYLGVSGTAAANNPISFQLGFSYVRKPEEVVKSGSAKSLIGITYSYQ